MLPKTTRQITLARGQIGCYSEPDGLDVSVKTARGVGRTFAPTWALVMEYKGGQLSDESYKKRYLARLDAIVGTSDDAIGKLVQLASRNGGSLVFTCYCRDGVFCHTLLLIDWLCTRWPALFIRRGCEAG